MRCLESWRAPDWKRKRRNSRLFLAKKPTTWSAFFMVNLIWRIKEIPLSCHDA